MTPIGWLFMLLSLGFVISLISFCFLRVLRQPAASNHMHAPLDIDTGDLDT